jgi:hypothetical protein
MTTWRRQFGAAVVALVVLLAGNVTAAVAASGSFSTTTLWAWANGPSLGTTTTGDQWASATVAGLSDADHVAGFRLRMDGSGNVLAAVSGTKWIIELNGANQKTGSFTPSSSSGTLSVSITTGNQVTIAFNGAPITTQTVTGSFTGLGITPSIWQSTATVAMTGIQFGTGTGSTTPPTTGPATWLSGASSSFAADGSYGTWRGEPVTVGGTWDDSLYEETALDSLSGWQNWTGALDEAIGAIWKPTGESWAQAAAGAYDSRWTASLTNLKAKWGSRDPAKLFIRFAHEMNIEGDWSVTPGEEADFRAALTRFSTLRYQIMPLAQIVLCTNDGTGTGIDVRDLFVARDGQGRRVVNVYATDTYNQYPHRTSYQDIMASFNDTDSSGAPVGVEAHREFAQANGVPFAVSEWGNCGIDDASVCEGGGGEAPAYVQAFNDWARAHSGSLSDPVAGQLLYEVQFNLRKQFELFPSNAQPQTADAYAALVWGK